MGVKRHQVEKAHAFIEQAFPKVHQWISERIERAVNEGWGGVNEVVSFTRAPRSCVGWAVAKPLPNELTEAQDIEHCINQCCVNSKRQF